MRPCKHFESGACLKGERCNYAHVVPAAEAQEAAGLGAAAAGQWGIYTCQAQPEPARFPGGFRPRRFCRVLLSGEFCRRGRNCSFAHHAYELHPQVLLSRGAVAEAALAAGAREAAGPPAPAQAWAPAPQQEAADPYWTGYRFMKGKRALTVCQFIYRRQVCPAGESCKLAHTAKQIDARALTEAIVDRFHEVMAEKYHAGMAPLPHGQEPSLGASMCEIDTHATATRSQAVHNASSSGSSSSSSSSSSTSTSTSSSSAAHSDQEVPAIMVSGARGRKAVRRRAETARSSSQARGSGVAVDCSRQQHGANKRLRRGPPRAAPPAPGAEAGAERRAAEAEAGSLPGTPSL